MYRNHYDLCHATPGFYIQKKSYVAICEIISAIDVVVLHRTYTATNRLPALPQLPPAWRALNLHWANKDI